MSDRLFSGNACDEGSNELPQHTYLKRRKASYNLEEYDAKAGPSNTIGGRIEEEHWGRQTASSYHGEGLISMLKQTHLYFTNHPSLGPDRNA